MKLLSLPPAEWAPLVFAQAGAPSGFDMIKQLAPVLIIFAIFYFLLIAPMRKQRRELKSVVDNLQKGDRVVTNGGLHGQVVAVEDGIVLLKVADNVKLKVSKSAVAGLAPTPGKSPEGKGTKS